MWPCRSSAMISRWTLRARNFRRLATTTTAEHRSHVATRLDGCLFCLSYPAVNDTRAMVVECEQGWVDPRKCGFDGVNPVVSAS